jgi:hypothetical protein
MSISSKMIKPPMSIFNSANYLNTKKASFNPIQIRQGNQGHQGIKGSNGFQGSRGFHGFQGSRGFHGSQGSRGFQGIGLIGPPGIGFQGDVGRDGPPGFSIQGFQGDVGREGPPGFSIQGFQGDVGREGPPGFSIQGEMGFQGDVGREGPPGFSIQGEMGFQGDVGREGPPGFSIQGERGFQGDIGREGAPGFSIQGERGFQGDSSSFSIQQSSFSNNVAQALPLNNNFQVLFPNVWLGNNITGLSVSNNKDIIFTTPGVYYIHFALRGQATGSQLQLYFATNYYGGGLGSSNASGVVITPSPNASRFAWRQQTLAHGNIQYIFDFRNIVGSTTVQCWGYTSTASNTAVGDQSSNPHVIITRLA